MIITANTNVLVRALVGDEPSQAAAASRVLREAEATAVPLPALCELLWVLRRAYGFAAGEISYVQGCDAVIHLVGDMTGAMAKPRRSCWGRAVARC
ncbi:MAG: hypothetical protein ACKOPS_07895 [Cyanobium sp.]